MCLVFCNCFQKVYVCVYFFVCSHPDLCSKDFNNSQCEHSRSCAGLTDKLVYTSCQFEIQMKLVSRLYECCSDQHGSCRIPEITYPFTPNAPLLYMNTDTQLCREKSCKDIYISRHTCCVAQEAGTQHHECIDRKKT